MAKRQVNKNLIAFLTVTGIVLSVVVVAVATIQASKKDPEIFARKAQQFEQQGDLRNAGEAWVRAYRAEKNVKYMIPAADVTYRRGLIGEALGMLKTAHAQSPDNEQVSVALLEKLQQLKDFGSPLWRDLRDTAADLAKVSPNNVLAQISLWEALTNLAEQDRTYAQQAEEALAKAVQLDPTDPRVAIARAFVPLRKAGELFQQQLAGTAPIDVADQTSALYDEAIKTLRDALAKHPGHPMAVTLLVDVLLERQRPEEARELLLASVQARPNDPDLRLGLARDYLREISAQKDKLTPEQISELVNKTREQTAEALRLEPAVYAAHMARAQTELVDTTPGQDTDKERSERYRKGLQLYRDSLQQTVGLRSLRATLGTNARAQMIVQAFDTAMAFHRLNSDPEDRKFAIELGRQFSLDATTEFPEFFITPYMQGELAILENDVVSATQAFAKAEERIRGSNSRYSRIIYERLALLYRDQGQDGLSMQFTDRAIQQYQDARENTPAILFINKGQLLNLLERPQEALDLTDHVARAYPNNPELTKIRAEALTRLGRGEEGRRLLAELPQVAGDAGEAADITVTLAQARLAAYDQDYPASEELLRKVLDRRPQRVDAMRLYVSVMVAQDKTEDARAYLKALLAKVDDEALKRVLEAFDISLSLKDPAERDAKLLEIIERTPDEKARVIDYYNFYIARNDLTKASEYLDQLEKLQPDDPGVLAMQFNLNMRMERFDRAEQYIPKLAAKDVDHAGASSFRGQLAFARKDPEKAISEFLAAEQKLPNDSTLKIRRAQALMSLAEPRPDEAIAVLQRVLESDPRNFQATKMLYTLLDESGNPGATAMLERAAKLNARDPFIQERVKLLEEQKDPRAGIVRREALRKTEPENVENLVRLGTLYAKVQDRERAEEVFKAARQAAPDSMGVMQFATQFYSDAKLREPGEAFLKEFINSQKELNAIRGEVLLARFYEALDDKAAAQEAYLRADRRVPEVMTDPEQRKSAQIGTGIELMEFYRRARQPEAVIEAARRLLGQIPADDLGRVPDTRLRIVEAMFELTNYGDAETELAAFLKDYPKDIRGLSRQAQLLIVRNKLPEAMDVLSRVLQQSPENAECLFMRGSVYFSMGRFTEARDDLLKAKQVAPNAFGLSHRLVLARLYEFTEQYPLAEGELLELVNANPSNAGFVTALIALYRNTNQLGRAQEVVGEYMARDPKNYFWPYQLGRLLMEREEYSAAIQPLQQASDLSGGKADVVGNWLLSLARGNRPEVAVQAYEKFDVQSVPPIIRANAAEAYAKLNQRDKAREILENAAMTAAAQNPNELGSVISRAAQILGQPEAFEMLRRLMKQPNLEPITSVNLRVVLGSELAGTKKAEFIPEALELIKGLLKDESVPGPTRPAVRMLYSVALEASGDPEGMVRELESLLKDIPNFIEALNNLAYVLADRLNRPAEALPYAEQLRRIAADNASILDTVGWVYFLNGRMGEAESTLLEGLRVDPANIACRYHLGRVYASQNQNTEARKAFQRAFELAKILKDEEFVTKTQEAMRGLK